MSEHVVLAADTRIRDRYRVLRLIGGGAMARVYLTEDTRTGAKRAVKVQLIGGPSTNGRSATLMEIAQREIDFLSALDHPSLPRITDYFRENDCIYLVMDYVEGHNLKTLLEANRGNALDVELVVRWGIQICDVLTYLHNQDPPIIFRDVKPSNIVRRPDDTIALVDFGIARQVREGASSDTMVFGSPGYAPPEQYGHDQTEQRSDIYALGATLHHLLTARDPSLTPFKWPAVRTLNPQVPLVLERLVMRCLEIEVARRPESVEAVGKSLRSIQDILEKTGTSNLLLPSVSGDPLAGMGVPSSRLASQDLLLITRSGTAELPARPVFLSETPVPKKSDGTAGKGSAGGKGGTDGAAGTESQRGGTSDLRPEMTQEERTLQALFRALRVCAVLVALLCVAYPFLHGWLVPQPPAIAGTTLPASANGAITQIKDAEIRERFQREFAQVQRRIEVYNTMLYVKYVLAALIFLAFTGGVLRPKRTTRAGMVLTIGGVLGLICLTAVTFLPAQKVLFVVIAFLECLILIPATILLVTPQAAKTPLRKEIR